MKVLSSADINKYMQSLPEYKNISWHGYMISVRHYITDKEMSDMIEKIIECSSDSNGVNRIMLSYYKRLFVVLYYALVDLKEEIDLFRLIYDTDIYSSIVSCVSKEQIDDIENIIKNIIL